MRIVSLLPAATEILLALGLEDELVGVTHRCEVPAVADEPVVLTQPGSEGGDALDAAALVEIDPDLVIAGDEEHGDIGARLVEAAFADGEARPSVLALAPSTVEGVLNGIVAVGAMTEAEDEAIGLVEDLRERLRGSEAIVLGRRDHGFQPPRVVLLSGIHPPRTVGRWVPDQVRLAGGWELLGQPGGAPAETTWEAIVDVDPEVLVLLPDGLPLAEAVRTWTASPRPDGWDRVRAVRAGQVFVVDASPFTVGGPRVIDGIEILAELIDPVAFDGMSPPGTWVAAV